MNFASWQGAGPCASGPAPGAKALEKWLGSEFTGRSGGIFNCRTVRGSQAPSIHGEGRAVDWMMPVRNGRGNPEGHEVVRMLGAVGKRLGVQAIIFDRKIWSARSPSGRAYTGVHPHYDHLHIELTREAGQTLTLATIRQATSGQTTVARQTRPTIRQGAKGEHVKALQRNLGGLAVDGEFGPKTADAVRKFQRAKSLKVDGIVGRQTWAALGL
jgi:hypothetical protein